MSLEKILDGWNPREIEALKRATADLCHRQGLKKRRPGVYWHKSKGLWVAHAVINRKRYYAGTSHDYELACTMSEQLEKRLLNEL